MTKEELEKEAEEYVYKALGFDKDYIKQELNRKYNPIEPWEKSEPIDPIINETMEAYLAGAEPREKRIEELEKENAELKTKKIPQLERRIASIRGSHSVDAKKLNARIEQVERLKKENAELRKEWQEQVQKANDEGYARTLQTIQLTKAKEIIKSLLQSFYGWETEVEFDEIDNSRIEQAEQFLSEVENV